MTMRHRMKASHRGSRLGPRSLGVGLAVASLAGCALDGITSTTESFNWKAGTSLHQTTAATRPRTYELHVPPKRLTVASVPVAWPLVIVLHGSSADGKTIEQVSAMNALADSALFLVAYPDATSGNFGLSPSDWNAGTCCGGAYRDNIDDLALITAIITQASQHVSVNTKKVYVAGFSAGARMAYHVGCQLSGSIAAIGVVSGSLVDDACAPKNPMPLIAIHGTDDAEVAYDEAAPPLPGTVPVAARILPPAVQFWTALYKCTTGTRSPVTVHVSRNRFTACATGTDIDFYSIDQGTHGWPGGTVEPGNLSPMNEIRASFLLWQFFTRHTHK